MEVKKYLNLDGLTEYDALIKAFVNSKVFIGTQAEYETANANGRIPVDALVIITDDTVADDETTGGVIIDSSNYAKLNSDNTYTGSNDFIIASILNATLGRIYDVNDTQGLNGQILTSTGNGIKWENIPEDVVQDNSYVHTDNNYTTSEKNKLGGIEPNATKVEESEVNGNIKINGVETSVYNLPNNVVQDSEYVHTDNNYTAAEKTKLSNIENGANKTIVDDTLSNTSTNAIQNKVITKALGNKVDKVEGKDLSTNDFTTTEKNKLSGIENNAQANVQSDWDATSGDSYIKNKPTKLSEFENDLEIGTYKFEDGYNSFYVTPKDGETQQVKVTPSIPIASETEDGLMSLWDRKKLKDIELEAQKNVQSNWLEQDETSDSFIRNKPIMPVVNDGKLIINVNGLETTFSANASESVGIDINFPKDISQFNNDKGYITKDDSALKNKVDKEDGKGLSTNDFTNEQKTKLDNIKEDELVYDTNYVHTDNNYTTEEKNKLAGVETNATKVDNSETNGNIKINGIETNVYTLPSNVVHDSEYVHTDNNYTTTEKNKLSNIQEGATKVEDSSTNGNILINGTETNVYTLPTDVVQDSNYVHTDNNYTTDEKNKLGGIESNAKKVEKSEVNGNIKISGNEVNVYTLPSDVPHDSNYVHTDNNYTTTEKNKLASVEQGATKVLVDNTMSDTSTNPVQNKVIVEELKNYLGVVDCEELPPLKVTDTNGNVINNPILDTKKLYRIPDVKDYSLGTTVPNTGTVEKVYLNTNLSVDEVKELINSVPTTDWVDSVWGVGKDLNIVRQSTGGYTNAIYITDNGSGQLLIYAPNLVWANVGLTEENTYYPAGWREFTNPIEINMEVGSEISGKPSGTYNNQLSRLFSITEYSNTYSDLGYKYYKYNNQRFELFGVGGSSSNNSNVDLSDYYTISESDALLLTKVDKVEGKGLSTNDFTNDYKNKLDGIEVGAEKNVQSDFAEEDTTNNSFIKNKPLENINEIPTPTAVASNAYVGNIYFNTSLSIEKILEILDSLTYTVNTNILPYPFVAVASNADMSKGIICIRGTDVLPDTTMKYTAYRIVDATSGEIFKFIKFEDGEMWVGTNNFTNGCWDKSEVEFGETNMLYELAPQAGMTIQNEQLKELISQTPFNNDISKIYRLPIERRFDDGVSMVVDCDYYRYKNGWQKIGFVKNEEANPLEVIDTKELENPTIEPIAVPSSGYVDKVYFNTKLNQKEVNTILEKLIYITNTNVVSEGSFVAVLTNADMSNGIVCNRAESTVDGENIIVYAMIDGVGNFIYRSIESLGSVVTPDDNNFGWLADSFTFGENNMLSDLAPQFGMEIQNEKLKSLISLTSNFESVENPNVKKDAIYRTSTQQKELVYKGTPVPTTSEVSKIYFNTNLSTLEVTRILERITYEGTSDIAPYDVISSGNGRQVLIVKLVGLHYVITFEENEGAPFTYIFSSADDSDNGLTAGWQGISELDFNGTNSYTEAGLQNDLLSSLISVTPFEQVEQEVPNTVDNYDYYRVKNGKWDKIFESLVEDVKELPTPLLGEAVTVPNTGYVEKVYFNTSMSIEEVGMIISTLTFDATLPAIGVLAGQNTALMILNQDGAMAIQDYVTGQVYWLNEKNASIREEDVSAGWQKGSILEVNSEVSPTFDAELEGQTITVNVGEQNEAIKSLISLTPYFEDVENPEVRKDKIYRVAIPKKGLVMKGTPVPVGEYVEKIYFNTFLSKNKFRELMDKVRKVKGIGAYMVFGSNGGINIAILEINDGNEYGILVEGNDTGEYIYSTDKMTGTLTPVPVGYFSISEYEVNSINDLNGIDTGAGIDNELLSDVFSITPFKPVIDYLPNTVDHYEYYRFCNGKWKLFGETD